MTNESSYDTTLHEPSMTADEVEMLLFALDRSRAQFAWKVGGLDAAGLLKHLALVEDKFTFEWVTGEPFGAPWNTVEVMSMWEWGWRSATDDSPAELYALWTAAVDRSRAAWSAALAKGGLDQPAAVSFGSDTPNLRRAMVDFHDEYARHVGHADLMREAVDGLVGSPDAVAHTTSFD